MKRSLTRKNNRRCKKKRHGGTKGSNSSDSQKSDISDISLSSNDSSIHSDSTNSLTSGQIIATEANYKKMKQDLKQMPESEAKKNFEKYINAISVDLKNAKQRKEQTKKNKKTGNLKVQSCK